MEKFQELKERSIKKLKVADHMLFVTYPVVKEAKLLIAVLENIFLSYTNSMAALLHYDRLFHKIPPFKDNFESKFHLFKEKCMPRYDLNRSYIKDMQELKMLLIEHKKSPVEFTKKDKFVICSDKFKMKAITVSDMKGYINKAKIFIQDIQSITSENERLFR